MDAVPEHIKVDPSIKIVPCAVKFLNHGEGKPHVFLFGIKNFVETILWDIFDCSLMVSDGHQ